MLKWVWSSINEGFKDTTVAGGFTCICNQGDYKKGEAKDEEKLFKIFFMGRGKLLSI